MPGSTPVQNLPYPVPDDSVDVPRDIKALADAIDPLGAGYTPIGGMMLWPTNVAPAGWTLCIGPNAGATAAAFPKLDALLGHDVNGYILLPDMRDRFPVGAGPTMALSSVGGASSVRLTDQESTMPLHDHSGLTGARDRSQSHTHSIQYSTSPGGSGAGQAGPFGATGSSAGGTLGADPADHVHILAPDSRALAAIAHENRPPYRSINFIMRAA